MPGAKQRFLLGYPTTRSQHGWCDSFLGSSLERGLVEKGQSDRLYSTCIILGTWALILRTFRPQSDKRERFGHLTTSWLVCTTKKSAAPFVQTPFCPLHPIACFHRSWDLAPHFAFQAPSLGHLRWIRPVCFTRRETSKRYWRPPCLASHTTSDTTPTDSWPKFLCVVIWKTVCHNDGNRPRIKRTRLDQWKALSILLNPSIQIANSHNWISGESGVTGGHWYCRLKKD